MTEPQPQTLRDIINKYSPIVQGKTGLLGAALKTAAFPLEKGRNTLGAIVRFPMNLGYENTAGQSVEGCKAIVADTFRRMEKKLQKSFNAAAAQDAEQPAQQAFLALADEIGNDSKILAGYCTVVNKAWGAAPEAYRFIVEPAAMTTLEQGVHTIRQALDAAEAVQDKNPVKIRIKLPVPQQQAQP